MVDSRTTIGTNLWVLGLVEVQRDTICVHVNTFLIKREC